MTENGNPHNRQPFLFWRRIFVLVVVLAVAMTGGAAFTGLWLANRTLAKRAVREHSRNLASIMLELHLPSSRNLLEKFRRISESEVLVTGKNAEIQVATLSDELLQELQRSWPSGRDSWTSGSGQRFFVSSSELNGRNQTLWLLFPEPAWHVFLPETSWWIPGILLAAGLTTVTAGLLIASAFRRLWCRLETADRRLELAERLALAGKMSASVLHELRNPLSGIRMNAQVMIEEENASGRHDSSLQYIVREIDRMDAYLRGLTGITGENSGSEPCQTPIGPFLSDLQNSQQARFRHAGVSLQVVCPEILQDQCIACHFSALWQVLLNLLNNALEVSPAGSQVKLFFERQENRVLLHLEDEGGGVQCPAEEDVFAPFVTSKPDGCGLGLHICRNTLERFSGSIGWKNTSKGARFSISLPLMQKIS